MVGNFVGFDWFKYMDNDDVCVFVFDVNVMSYVEMDFWRVE